jgi:hypothetical protein
MPRRRRHSLVTPGNAVIHGVAFPVTLLEPPQSEVGRFADDVSDRIQKLDDRARGLAELYGIPFTTFVLNAPAIPDQPTRLDVAMVFLSALAIRWERVTLERHGGRWGLYFTREPAVLAPGTPRETVPLRDAPLDVRERFLQQSEAFFAQYLILCQGRVLRMSNAVAAADKTLAHLDELERT